MNLKPPPDTYCYVVEETYDNCKLLCYFRVYGGTKSTDYDVPDDGPDIEVWAYTIVDPKGHEIRIDSFDFTEMWDEDEHHQYILDNLSELTS